MALYQQILDIYPEEFSDRKIPSLKESLQKSIYSTVHSGLFPNYINELQNNDPDSFLIIPIFLANPMESTVTYQEIIAILTKEDGLIKFETYDESPRIVSTSDRDIIDRRFEMDAWIDGTKRLIPPVYKYTFENTLKNISLLADTLRLGRFHLSSEEKNLFLEDNVQPYNFLKDLSEFIVSQSGSKHVSRMNFPQPNSGINNLAGALKYVLGQRYLLKKGKPETKSKFKTFTTEELNFTLVQLIIHHLEKLGYSQKARIFLEEQYNKYKQFKDERSNLDISAAFQQKGKTGIIMNFFYENIAYYRLVNEKEARAELKYDYGLEVKRQDKSEEPIDYSKKTSLYHLSQDEIKKIREIKVVDSLQKSEMNKRKLEDILVSSDYEPSAKKRKGNLELTNVAKHLL